MNNSEYAINFNVLRINTKGIKLLNYCIEKDFNTKFALC